MVQENASKVTRRTFFAGCLLAGEAVLAAGWTERAEAANVRRVKEEDGRIALELRHPYRFRILQVTDLHYFGGKRPELRERDNGRTTERLKTLIKLTRPDLLMVTGDLWPEDRDGKAVESMHWVIGQLESMDIPWAYTWGNHDKLPDYAVGHEAFTQARNSLYRGAKSNGNYTIDIVNHHGHRAWQLLCMNSHQDGLGTEAREWLKGLAAADPQPVPRLAFFHIPLKQYDDLWASGAASGFKGETVSNEQEDGSTFPILKSLNVKACFCGHDHVNDFSGTLDGVELVYGRASGAAGYRSPRFAKGGKLIMANGWTHHCRWCSVTEDRKTWHPKRGERVDDSRRL